MTLRGRLVWAAAIAVAATVALVVIVVFWAERRELRLLIDAELRRSAEQVAADLLQSGEVDDTLRPEPLATLATYAQVVTASGEVIPLTRARAVLPVTAAARAVANGEHDRFYTDDVLDGVPVRTLTVPVAGGALQVARTVADAERHLLDLAALLVVVGVGGVGLAILLGRLVARAALRPVAGLSAAAERIAETGDLAARLEVHGDDELSRLGRTVNRMLAALETSVCSQQQLVADASHELRTPLTSLRANLDVLERTDRHGPPDRAALVADLRAEVESLVSAVDDLLALSRDEAAARLQQELAVEQIVDEALAAARRRARDTRFDVQLQPVTVTGDRVEVLRAVTNLLDNAITWSPPEGVIEVHLDEAELTVRDRGPGIPATDLPHVFERFYRAPEARARPGAGLGLAIVRKVADDHGWDVDVENAEPGARFRLRFTTDSSRLLRAGSASAQSDVVSSRPRRTRPGRVWSIMRRPSTGRTSSAWWVVGALLGIGSLLGVLGVPVLAAGTSSALTTVSGTLTSCGDQWCVDGRVVDFGPIWYVSGSQAPNDYDGDGRRGAIVDELAGLRDSEVVLEVEVGTAPAAVFTIDGLTYRELGAPPVIPWRAGPPWVAQQNDAPVASASPAEPGRPGGGQAPAAARDAGDATPSDGGAGVLRGVLERCGTEWCVAGTVLDLGPIWYVMSTPAPEDLDGDGTRGAIAEEIAGLAGEDVRVRVEPDRDEATVIAINGGAVRTPEGPPPWAGGPLRSASDNGPASTPPSGG